MTTSDVATRIKQAVDAVDLIGQVVPLRRVGSRYMGLCPFHREKTPSFQVDAGNGLFYCFGCGAGGDVITFAMRHWDLDFGEAVRYLAERYHVPLPELEKQRPGRRSSDTQAILSALEEACTFYYRQLHQSEKGRVARDYIRSRGLTAQVVEQQRLGYAPDGWNALLTHFRRRGISEEVGVQAGLFITSKKGTLYDRFRHRLIFPITNGEGKVVAFGGRSLDGSEPKYLNSPETPVYHKGRMLYQWATAREACRQVRQVLLVEGYMDLLAFHLHGFYRVVATLGTALTVQQVRLMGRVADEVVLVYDGDAAGRRAMLRTLPLFAQEGVSASCLVLPEAMDPDDYLSRHGLEAFLALLEKRQDLAHFAVDHHVDTWNGTSQDKVRVLKDLQEVVRQVAQPVVRQEIVSHLAERLALPQSVVQEQLFASARSRAPRPIKGIPPAPARGVGVSDIQPPEETITRLLVLYPELAREVSLKEALGLFRESPLRTLVAAMAQQESDHGTVDPDGLLRIVSDAQAVNLLTRYLMERDQADLEIDQARILVLERLQVLREQNRKKRFQELQQRLQKADQEGDAQMRRQLLKEYQALCATVKRG
ncbi:DNA primase [Desulfacinum hydrothermale DSM 13146]|uniref:DNA primase n=1 Tax=Desulfacinum hydrothermale DSM 13146 TaxID=1121390 RepID=A0A1W1XKD7_9BACT|nr:DNA primase [Desulfacinum hydrothermale]SMC24001.1 DNA primase [Desulfacinum hydrothermale DSM 13146]